MDRVRVRLEEIFGDRTKEFLSLLNKCGAVLSGSFIIQSILGENWRDSDVDLYLPENPLRSPSDNPSSEIDAWLLQKVDAQFTAYYAANRYGDSMSRGDSIVWIRNYLVRRYQIPLSRPEKKCLTAPPAAAGESAGHGGKENGDANVRIQLIFTNLQRGAIDDYIRQNFDFSICKNVYKVVDGHGSLSVADLSSILRRRFVFEWAGNPISSLNRMQKYRARGFAVEFDLHRVVQHLITESVAERAKSNALVIPTSVDISHLDRSVYRTFPREVDDYTLSGTALIEAATNGRCIKKCDEEEILFGKCVFTSLGLVHLHTDGKHRGHGACEYLTIIQYPPLTAPSTSVESDGTVIHLDRLEQSEKQ